jgi:magnesium-protoporphyrin IX monomethyl ester (oxidative) cyclase
MLIRCWPSLRQGFRGKLLSRFFLWSVFLTHSLTVCQRGEFYRILGMDPEAFDAEVMRQTNRTARRVFPWVFDLDNGDYIALRDRLVSCFQDLQAAREAGAGLLRQLGLRLRFGGLLWRQFTQPMVPADAG